MEKIKCKKDALKLTTVADWLIMLVIFSVITLLINALSYKNPVLESLPGMLILVGITLLGLLLSKLIPLKIPAMIYISVIAFVIALPYFGGFSTYIVNSINKINTLGLCTVILSYSGVAIGKNWNEFKKMGWKGIVITILVIIGTYLGSALIAELLLSLSGII